MACFRNSSRFCVRVQKDKLCQLLLTANNSSSNINNNNNNNNSLINLNSINTNDACNSIVNNNNKSNSCSYLQQYNNYDGGLIQNYLIDNNCNNNNNNNDYEDIKDNGNISVVNYKNLKAITMSSSLSSLSGSRAKLSATGMSSSSTTLTSVSQLSSTEAKSLLSLNEITNDDCNFKSIKCIHNVKNRNLLLIRSNSHFNIHGKMLISPIVALNNSTSAAAVIRNYSTKSKSTTQLNHYHTSIQQQQCQKSKNKTQDSSYGIREYSSVHTQQPGPAREFQVDPYLLLEDDLKYFYDDIRKFLNSGTNQPELETIASYYFDGQGKALRPMVALLMAKAVNYHINKESRTLLSTQRKIAIFSEMVHSASLVHDDVIDQSDFRRGKPSVNALWNHKKVTMAGDFILSVASVIIARLQHDDVTIILSQILTDLVQGEFMQLGSKETENERFAHYLTKTYRKTASLIANTLKSVAVIAGADDSLSELAFQYGRNVGLAFQLVDDLLDFVSSTEAMGKPTAADLKLGLATAPVLFACEKYPELNPMIMRRFQEPGDVERAFELVHKSQGLEQTRFLARKHCIEAIRLAQEMTESPYQKGLIVVSDLVINRMK